MNEAEWMKGISYTWSRVDRPRPLCLKTDMWRFAHKSDLWAQNVGEYLFVRRSVTASRVIALVFGFRMCNFYKSLCSWSCKHVSLQGEVNWRLTRASLSSAFRWKLWWSHSFIQTRSSNTWHSCIGSVIHGLITNPHIDKLPFGLITH